MPTVKRGYIGSLNYRGANHFQYILIFPSKSSLQRQEEQYRNPCLEPTDYLKAVKVIRMTGESSEHRTAKGRGRAKGQGRIWEEQVLHSEFSPNLQSEICLRKILRLTF